MTRRGTRPPAAPAAGAGKGVSGADYGTVGTARDAARRPRRRRMAGLLVAVLLAVVTAISPADTAALAGATGLLQIPTADVLPQGHGRLAAGVDGQGVIPSVSYGVMPGLEVGLAVGSGSALAPQLKYAVAAETSGAPGLAVGLTGDSLYAVLSRRWSSQGLRVHVGVGTGRWGPVLAGVEARLRSVTVAAADAGPPPPAVSLLLDYDGRAVALGARLDWASGWTVSAGVRAGEGLVGAAGYTMQF